MPTSLADLPVSSPGQELRTYDPTWRDRIAHWLMTRGPVGTGHQAGYQPSLTRENFVRGLMGSIGVGRTGIGLADPTPLGLIGEIRAIPQNGIEKEHWRICHDDPTRRRGKETRRLLTRPEAFGYRGEEVPPEYMAEAIRAYLADPNYIKTVAPETARRIRQHVNSNRRLNKQLQFNSAPAAAAGALGYAAAKAEEDGQ